MAAIVRLGAFLALVAVLFLVAFLAGRGVGPVTLVHGHSGSGSDSGSGSGSGSGMNMGSNNLLLSGRR